MAKKPTPIRLAPDLALPVDAVTRTFGIFGQRETGKSTTAAVIVEQSVHAGGRAVVMDPTGVWFGLTRAGTGPGLPGVVLGGEHADAPLEPNAGALVAEFVIASDYPLVVLDMKLMRKHQRQHFAMEFLEALYHDNRDPLLVVLDEAAQFAPTHMREGGDVPRLLGAVEDLVKLGRSRGLGAAMIEQRIATLNANVREQIGTLVAHRLVGPLDRKALKEWINAQGEPEREAEALAAISKLDPGTALVWSPAWIKFFGIVAMNNATTFDSRATPRVGERRKAPGKRAPVDLATLSEKMAAAIEDAKANDPKELKRMNAELGKKLKAAEGTIEHLERTAGAVEARVEKVIHEVKVPVFRDGELEALGKLAGTLASVAADLSDAAKSISTAVETAAAKVVERVREAERVEQKARRPEPPPPPRPAPPSRPRSDAQVAASNGSLSGPEQRVLDAIAWYGALGNHAPSKQQVGFIAGYRVGKNVGGTYGNILGKLRNQHGLIDYVGGNVVLTEQGAALARDPGIEATNEAMQDAVIARLSGPEERVLRVLIEAWPNPMTKQAVGAASGYTVGANVGGTFGNILGKLRSLGVIDYPSPGEAVALDVLFPMG